MKHLTLQEKLGGMGLLGLKKRRLQGDIIYVFNSMVGCCRGLLDPSWRYTVTGQEATDSGYSAGNSDQTEEEKMSDSS